MNKTILHLFASSLVSFFLLSCAAEETWESLTTKGRKAQQANSLVEAEDCFLKAMHIAQGLPDNDNQLSKSYFRLGMFYHYRGYYLKAAYYYQHALDLDKRLYGSSNRHVATVLNNLANIHLRQGQYAEAQQLLTEGVAIWKEIGDLENMVYITSLIQQAVVYREEERWTEAENLFQHAITLGEQIIGVDMGLALDQWGLLYEQQGNLKKAKTLYTQAVKWHETHYGHSDAQLAKSLTFLGSLHLKQENVKHAKLHLQRALAIQEKIFGAVHPDLAITLEQYAKLLRLEHHDEEAQEFDSRVQSMKTRLSAPFVPNRTASL